MKSKAFISASVFTLLYAFLCLHYPRGTNEIIADQGQWSMNIINAQTFLYDLQDSTYNCILGTSMAARIDNKKLPSNFYNLSFSGQALADGLEILEFKNNLPDTLFIETNYFSKPASESFLNTVASSKEAVRLKEVAVFLQEKNKPLGLLANILDKYFNEKAVRFRFYGSYALHIIKNKIKPSSPNIDEKQEENTFYKDLLGVRHKVFSSIKDKERLLHSAQRNVQMLKELEKRSVTLIFFEMPMDCSLLNSNQLNFDRELVEKEFPKITYRYIKADCHLYSTTDGIHLDNESASRFASFLISKCKRSVN